VIENYLQNVFVLFDILGRTEDALAHFGHPVSCILVGSVLLLILVFCVVLLCVFTFLVPCCGVLRFLYKMMFGLSLSQVVYKKTHVLFTLFVFLCVECPTHIVLRVLLRFSSFCVLSTQYFQFLFCPFGFL
jgi:hypothetical protein